MASDDIGYGKPPKRTRFKPGVSGNPSGRPKGRLSLNQIFEKHLDVRVPVNIGGKKKKLSRREVVVMSFVSDAFKGNAKVRKQLLDLMLIFDAQTPGDASHAADSKGDQSIVASLLYSYGLDLTTDGETRPQVARPPARGDQNQPVKKFKITKAKEKKS